MVVLVLVVAAGIWWAVYPAEGEPAARAQTQQAKPQGGPPPSPGPEVPSLGQETGAIADGRRITPLDTDHPAVRYLDEELLKAVQKAAVAARGDGIELFITSGWRSKEYQRDLLKKAVEKYGSLEKAREFVATPEKSAHVSGKAVDIGPTDADDWLIRKGRRFGLCQAYANEIWHFELLTQPGAACPAPQPDATG
ncbi:M15 family metallopeptidase [Streptomyces sp. NPDC093707]|uniref:M15 family metallopeptidase n=1 Tax=Streptomyces sp. NPDC093707 TaxID=3154984 RepID=UPI00344BC3AC